MLRSNRGLLAGGWPADALARRQQSTAAPFHSRYPLARPLCLPRRALIPSLTLTLPPAPAPLPCPAVSYDGSLKAWDATSLDLVMCAPAAHEGQRIHCLAMGPDRVLYTGGSDQVRCACCALPAALGRAVLCCSARVRTAEARSSSWTHLTLSPSCSAAAAAALGPCAAGARGVAAVCPQSLGAGGGRRWQGLGGVGRQGRRAGGVEGALRGSPLF